MGRGRSWDGGKKSCGAVTACQITGLKNGTEYTFTVRAQNEVGWSDSSKPVSATPDKVPDAPQDVSATGGYKKVHVHWTAPKSTASTPTGYTVTINGAPHASEGTRTEIDLPVDTNGKISVTVSATNKIGAGKPSEPVSADVYGDPDPPIVTVAQDKEKDEITVSTKTGNLHGAGCSAIEIVGHGSIECGGSTSFDIERDMYFTDFKVDAILKPAKSDASEAKATSNTIRISADIGTVTITDASVRDNNICTAAWSHSGKVDDVQFTFGPESGTKGASDSAEVRIDPWTQCPTITVTPRFKGQNGTPATTKHDYTYKTDPRIHSGFALKWDTNERNRIQITNNGFDLYNQETNFALKIGDKTYPLEQTSTFIDVDEDTSDTANWLLTVEFRKEPQHSATANGTINGIRKPKPAPTPDPSPSPSEPSPSPSEGGEAQPSAFRQRSLRPYGQLVAVPGSRSMVFL